MIGRVAVEAMAEEAGCGISRVAPAAAIVARYDGAAVHGDGGGGRGIFAVIAAADEDSDDEAADDTDCRQQ